MHVDVNLSSRLAHQRVPLLHLFTLSNALVSGIILTGVGA